LEGKEMFWKKEPSERIQLIKEWAMNESPEQKAQHAVSVLLNDLARVDGLRQSQNAREAFMYFLEQYEKLVRERQANAEKLLAKFTKSLVTAQDF